MIPLRIALLALALASSTLAGCLGAEPEPTTNGSPSTTTPSSTPPATSPPTGGTPPTNPTSPPAAQAVAIQGFAFVPATLEIPVGAKVVWTNKDSTLHTVDGDGLSSGDMPEDDTYEFTFIQAGTFEYVCAYHSNMKGTIKAGQGETVKQPTPPPANADKVVIDDFQYTPKETTVLVGTTVTWTNMDSGAHTVTLDDGSFDSGNVDVGASTSRQFAAPGTFAYHCAYHPSMTGRVVVT